MSGEPRKGDRVVNTETGQVGMIYDPSYQWRGERTVLVELPDEEWRIPWKRELVALEDDREGRS